MAGKAGFSVPWARLVRESAGLILLALALGLLVNALRTDGRAIPLWPEYLKGYRSVSLEEAAALHGRENPKAVFLDARPGQAFKEGHIKGAIFLFPGLTQEEKVDPATKKTRIETSDYFKIMYPILKRRLPEEGPIVVYGRTFSQHLAALLAWRLAQEGQGGVLVLEAGLEDWAAAGLPVTRRAKGGRSG